MTLENGLLMNASPAAIMIAGVPSTNRTLFHRVRFAVGDPAVLLEIPQADGSRHSIFIVRDIEMQRAREQVNANRIACPADFAPENGLSGDRETATAQAAAECLRRAGLQTVVSDRTLALIYVDQLRQAGLHVEYDPELGVRERRAKDAQEIEWLQESQRTTEEVMRMTCQWIAKAEARSDAVLLSDGEPLTSERVKTQINHWLLERGYSNPHSIVACGSQGADCHHSGSGELRTEQPIIVDIFPCNQKTHYWGDCTRTVVHGTIPSEVAKMHAAVVEAKAAATAAVRAGVTGEQVHQATCEVITKHGYGLGLPEDPADENRCAMVHGTGHGLGLEVHEPPLLDRGGPPLVAGDAITIEPGLYCPALGGIRVEDLVIVTQDGCRNLNQLPESLSWK